MLNMKNASKSIKVPPFRKMLDFLDLLDREKIHYKLEHVRDSIMICIAVPGQRWEVEFFEDGHLEFERFMREGEIEDERFLREYIKPFLEAKSSDI